MRILHRLRMAVTVSSQTDPLKRILTKRILINGCCGSLTVTRRDAARRYGKTVVLRIIINLDSLLNKSRRKGIQDK